MLSSVPLVLHASRLLAALLLLLPAAGVAAPAPVGNVYAIGDRPVPTGAWWRSCSDADGNRAQLETDCSDCESEHGDIFLQRYDAGGHAVGPRVKVNEEPAWLGHFRVTCSTNGFVAAQWTTGCWLHRVYTPHNVARSAPVIATEPDCRTRASLAVTNDGDVLATWPSAVNGPQAHIVARRFDAGGQPSGDIVQVSDGEAAWRRQPKIAVDGNGAALVTWLGRGEHAYSAMPVMARAISAAGNVKGPSLRLDTFPYGEALEPTVSTREGGVFEVAWTSPLEGGRVARRVELNPTAATASIAAAAADDAAPSFGAARVLASRFGADGDNYDGRIGAGDGDRWLFSATPSGAWRSTDDSVTWDGSLASGLQTYTEHKAGNGESTWIAVAIDENGATADLLFVRSANDGGTWSPRTPLAANPLSCDECSRGTAAVAGSRSGTWIAAWSFAGYDDHAGTYVAVARSRDDGKTWSAAKIVATDRGLGARGFELATDSAGKWVLLFGDTDLWAVGSSNDGVSWSSPKRVAQEAWCESCAAAARHSKIAVAGAGGTFVALFGAPRFQTGEHGFDGDVFVIRSTDGGGAWTAPKALAPYADDDGSPDFAPSLATDGAGRWIATWISHHRAGGGDSLDSDVFTSASQDGAAWSAPALLRPEMETDEAGDTDASIAAKSDGRWLAAWHRTSFESTPYGTDERLLVTAADATCANAVIEIGEQCDDANHADDDGCDSNCLLSGCGNGIVNTGEECDDGNVRNDDGCVSTCRTPRCGDGFVSAGESCDDGNTADGDECNGTCGLPYCGDGSHNPPLEECDRGPYPTQTCTPECRLARCGDGYLAPYAEACDDGNDVDDDECPNDCSRFVCGDGRTALGFEECDFADRFYADACTGDCRLVGLCGDANADEQVTVSDARIILSTAVGLPVGCPRAACDMDSSGRIGVQDAQMDLRKAVGISVGDVCSIGTGTIVFWIQESRPIGAFMIDIEYGRTGGNFLGTRDGVQCRNLLPEEQLLSSFNDNEATGTLTAGFISLQGFSGITDLFACEFELPETSADMRFVIRVLDAADPNLNPLIPAPLIGYRLE